jgi:hypothetical protein
MKLIAINEVQISSNLVNAELTNNPNVTKLMSNIGAKSFVNL